LKRISLAFSPCPNDTFIFDAIVHNKIDTEGFQFDYELHDVEYLNLKAFDSKYDVTKLSFHAYAHLNEKYVLLTSGAALGNNCGPLLVCSDLSLIEKKGLENCKIAIPGKYTTAHFLLNIFNSSISDKQELLFSDIERAILEKRVDAGVLIHENRFTYAERGLKKIADLGEYWEKKSGFPIPLGAIAIKRSFDSKTQQQINRIIKRSIEFAFANPDSGKEFVKQNAAEMSEEVMYKHINLYVNQHTLDLQGVGKQAVSEFYRIAENLKVIPKFNLPIFIEQ
jgi:1,4-dihydroxy-6-naphthoate synthase